MATDLRNGTDTSVTTLVTGIINDVQELLRQQLALFKSEFRSDFAKTKDATLALAAGAGVCLMGVALLLFMVVHLLHAYTVIPLWGCFGIVGGVLAAVGAALLFAGKKKFESFNPLPDESAQAMKENVQCLMNPR